MRPNIEEIQKRLNKASRNEKWFVEDGSSIFVTWYSGRDVKIAEAVRPVWHENRFKGDEETYYNAEFIAHSRTDIPVLLAYIDELENMPLVQRLVEQNNELEFLRKLKDIPLVQTVVERDREIEQLNEVIKERTNDVIHYDSENKKLQEEIEQLRESLKSIRTRLGDFQGPWNDREREIDAIARKALEDEAK